MRLRAISAWITAGLLLASCTRHDLRAPAATPPPEAAPTAQEFERQTALALAAQTPAAQQDQPVPPRASAPPPLPADGRPGECIALVERPAQYQTAPHQFVAVPGSVQPVVSPARVERSTETLNLQDGYERIEEVPATFKLVTERIEVAPAQTRYLASDPVYASVRTEVVSVPAHSVWRTGPGKIQRTDPASGEVQHLVDEPPQYETITRQVQKQPQRLVPVTIPAQYQEVTHAVIDHPAELRRVWVPAQQTQVPVERVLATATIAMQAIPAQSVRYQAPELTAPPSQEWRAIVCQTALTHTSVRRLQLALRAQGLDPGTADGVFGSRTRAALNAYQQAHGLPEDRYVNLATATALGLQF